MGMDVAALQLFTRNLRRDCRTTLKRFLTLQVSGSDDTECRADPFARELI